MKLYRFLVQHTVLFFVLYCFFVGLSAAFIAHRSLPLTQLIAYEWLLCLVWIALYTVLMLYPLRIYKQILNSCTPEKGVEFTDSVLRGADVYKRIQRSLAGDMLRAVLIDRAMFLTLLGRFDEALSVYAMLEQHCGTLQKKYMVIMYHNLIMLACAQGNTAAAQCYFEQETALLQHGSVRLTVFVAAMGKSVKEILLADEICLSIRQGDLARAEALYRRYQTTVKPRKNEWLINRVCDACEVGTLYYRMGNFAEAAPRLRFAADNGGTTFYCARAKELLTAIQQMNTNANTNNKE